MKKNSVDKRRSDPLERAIGGSCDNSTEELSFDEWLLKVAYLRLRHDPLKGLILKAVSKDDTWELTVTYDVDCF